MPLPLVAVGVAAAGGGGILIEGLDRLRRRFGGGTKAQNRARLVQFYQRHNPEKVGEVDDILTMFEGEEEELWRSLYEKYGFDENGQPVGIEDVLRDGEDDSSGGVGGGISDGGGEGGSAVADAASSSQNQRRDRGHSNRKRRHRQRGSTREHRNGRSARHERNDRQARRERGQNGRSASTGGRHSRADARSGRTIRRNRRSRKREGGTRSRNSDGEGQGVPNDLWSLDSDDSDADELFRSSQSTHVQAYDNERITLSTRERAALGEDLSALDLGSDDELLDGLDVGDRVGQDMDMDAAGAAATAPVPAQSSALSSARGIKDDAGARGGEFDFEFEFNDSDDEWLEDEGANDSSATDAVGTGSGADESGGASSRTGTSASSKAKKETLLSLEGVGALYRFVARDGVYTEVYRGKLLCDVSGSWLTYPLVLRSVDTATGHKTELLRASVSSSFVPGFCASARFDDDGGEGKVEGRSEGEDATDRALELQVVFADEAGARQQWRLELSSRDDAEALCWCLAQLRAHMFIHRAPPAAPVVLANLPPTSAQGDHAVRAGDRVGIHFTAWAAPEQGEDGARARPDKWVSEVPIVTNVGGSVAKVVVAEASNEGGASAGDEVGDSAAALSLSAAPAPSPLPGLDIGVRGMPKGGRRLLLIPAAQDDGAVGCVISYVQILKVKKRVPPEQALKEMRQRLEAAEAEARAARKDATDAQGEVQQMRADQRARALAPPPAPVISVPTISGAPAAAQARNNSGPSDMRRASWSLTSGSSSRSHMDADRAVAEAQKATATSGTNVCGSADEENEDDGIAPEPCDNYSLDMAAATFGMCYCGHPKTAHRGY